MARYIKANPKVAKFLNLESDRNTVKDGNYLLWQSDMLKFGPLTQLSETLTQIGAIALLAHEAKEEQEKARKAEETKKEQQQRVQTVQRENKPKWHPRR